MEARIALFQETVGKLSPPRIEVDLMLKEDVEELVGQSNNWVPSFLLQNQSILPPRIERRLSLLLQCGRCFLVYRGLLRSGIRWSSQWRGV